MEVRNRPRPASWVWGVAAALSAAIFVVMAVKALRSDGGLGADDVESLAVPLLGVLLATTLVTLWAWRRDQRAAGALLAGARHAQQEAEGGIGSVRSELEAERARREGLERRHQLERRWVDELRAEVGRLHEQQGVLGTGDVRDLVLRVALEMTGAQRGMLLEHGEDGDGDGLRVARHVGFEHDPSDSEIAQRLARQVLRRDETLRDDAPSGDLRNLVALPVYAADEFSGVVVCADRDGGFGEVEDELLLSLGDHAGAVLHSSRLHGQLRSAYLSTVGVLAAALEIKDPFLRGHSDDVANLVAAVADRLGVAPSRREELVFGSLLHDVGKLGISERILLKPAALTAEERAAVEQHPRIGFRLIEQVPALRSIAPAVLHHHERFDGDGYPAGLKGQDIPLEARIVCVADCFSAMTSDRPYRAALSVEDACAQLVDGAGSQFDPEVVGAFVEEVRRRAPLPAPRSPLDDPELAALRHDGEALIGSGAATVVDSLTLLYSHRHLQETAAAEAERAALQGSPFTVVVGELADLAERNRQEGYAAGDRVLREVAGAFDRAAARTPGAVAARLSGRRLAVLVPGGGDGLSDRIAAELDGTPVRLGTATWRTGERGEDVVTRAALEVERLDHSRR
jgi:HD-GYP domain-containing protein (c-di-GMP phosphodiesterase class II)/GGDEF domain-containing protein